MKPVQPGQPIDLLYTWGDHADVGAALAWLQAQSNLTYTGAVTNAGPDAATSVTLTIPLASGLLFQSINLLQYGAAGLIIFMIVITVATMDFASAQIRKRLV